MKNLIQIPNEVFTCTIQLALSKFEIKSLADEIGVSKQSIERWSEGKNLPHYAVRQTIFNYITKKIINNKLSIN